MQLKTPRSKLFGPQITAVRADSAMNFRRSSLTKFSALSFSMPDVTGGGFSNSPGYYGPAEDIVEEGEEDEERETDTVSSTNQWEDDVDPTTGFVFYVDSAPRPHPRYPNGSAIPPSTSSSSLSSSTSSQLPLSSSLATSPLAHHPFSMSLPPTPNHSSFTPPFPPPQPTSPQFTKRASEFSLPSPTLSEKMMRFPERDVVRVPPSPDPSPFPSLSKSQSTSNMTSVGKSVKNKIRKFVRGGSKHSRSTSSTQSPIPHRMVPSGSFPNLSSEADLSSHPESQLSTPHGSQQSPPHGSLYGSGGFSLSPDSHTIISVCISLKPRPPTIRPHRHWNLEKLGIIPARALGGKRYRSFSNLSFGFHSHHRTSSSSSTKALIIRGILPGSPASFAPKLQPGDTILTVNGHPVNLQNANNTIRSMTDEELVLIIKKNSFHHSTLTSTPAHHHLYTSSRRSSISSLVSGKKLSHHHHSPPHLLLYLTLDTKEDDPANKDILYCYPKDALPSDDGGEGRVGRGDSTRSHLLQLRGVFLTLSDVMASITTEKRSCSTVYVRGQSFNLAHIQCQKEVLLLALPASVLPRHLVLATAERAERILQLLFGSPQRAFMCSDNHSTVDHLLTLLFHHLSYSHPHTSHPHPLTASPLTSLTTVPRYMVSVDATLCVSEALDALEAVSPTHRMTDIAHAPRTLFPHGSFLFYQGQLVQSHLQHSELKDVMTFCQAYRLLEISRQDPRTSIVIWRQIHLSGRQSASLDDTKTSPPIFLFIVGMDHMLVGLVMEGCGLTPEATPTLDPVYVNEAKQLIAKLDTQDVFSTSTAGAAVATPIPPVISLDKMLTTHLSTPHQSPHVTSHSHRLSVPHLTSGQGSDTDEEEAPFTTRSNTLPSFLPRGKRGKWKHVPREVIHPKPLPTDTAVRQNYILTAGADNILLHYLCVEAGQGVWLGPIHHDSSLYGTIHHEMITSFQTTCTAIRAILLAKTQDEEESDDEWTGDSEEEDDKEDKPSSLPPFSQPLPGGKCVEHGVLLDIPLKNFVTDKHIKTVPSLSYWVVGRLFPDTGKEFYICYEESTSQTTVEMAFKLLFGTSPTS